jgi:hypothetical protein
MNIYIFSIDVDLSFLNEFVVKEWGKRLLLRNTKTKKQNFESRFNIPHIHKV